jgi:hypothetical protein
VVVSEREREREREKRDLQRGLSSSRLSTARALQRILGLCPLFHHLFRVREREREREREVLVKEEEEA